MFVSKRKSLFWVFQFWLVLFTFSSLLGYFSAANPVQAAALNSLPASGPNLSVNPGSVTFTARKYDSCTAATPSSSNVTLTTTSSTTVNWSVAGNVTYDNSGFANWLSFSTTNGTVSSTTPATITLSVYCSSLPALGNYTATVKVADTNDATNFTTFTVTFSVIERGVRATRVYGQPDLFSNSTTGQATATDLNAPQGVALDNQGGLYVVDVVYNRVLFYPSGSTTATRVYGQPDFTSSTINYGGSTYNGSNDNVVPAASSLWIPIDVVFDPFTGGIYVADQKNRRVLYYPAGSTTATQVYGKPNFTTYAVYQNPTASNIDRPSGLAIDPINGGLYVADDSYNRVLYYPRQGSTGPVSTLPSQVYGQAGSYTTAGSGTSPTTFHYPEGLVVDSSGGLYVADAYNGRVVYFPPISNGPAQTTATGVYGQVDLYSSNHVTGAAAISGPQRLALDSNGNLFVSDSYDHASYNSYNRVTVFPKGSTTAYQVYGHFDLNGIVSNSDVSSTNEYGLERPYGITVDPTGGLYVADTGNSRVIYYNTNVASVNLTSSVNPANLGQAVTFTATVTPSVASNGYPTHPTGQVIFKDGTTVLGSVTLPTSGSGASVATFNVTNFTSGTHPIVAVYSGDTFFAAASSNLVNQVVTTTQAPVFSVDKTQLYFLNTSGGSSSSTVSLSLSSGTTTWTSSIQYTGTPPFNWLSLTPASGSVSSTSSATITFRANSSRVFPRPTIYLAAGVYNAVVTFTDTNNSNNKVSVNVSYEVCSTTQC